MTSESSPRRGQVGVGLLLIGLGVLFLVGQLTGVRLGQFTWPLFIILPGLAFFAAAIFGGRDLSGLAIPGSVITTVGLILFYQNLTNHWESWSYAWGLIVSAVGVGIILHGVWGDVPGARRDGQRVLTIGLVMFAIGFVFFELILGISNLGGPLRPYLAPAVLIVLGVLLLGGQLARRGAAASPSELDKPPAPKSGPEADR